MIRLLSCSILSLTLALGACSRSTSESAPAETSAGHGAKAAEYERGPHRGRLLRDGNFSLELQIFEDGVDPEFHVYLFRDNQPLPPTAAKVGVELTRLGNKIDRFEFSPKGDYLLGGGTVYEPHSFSVVVSAEESGQSHRWTFDSFEGRTSIAAQIAADAGVKIEIVGPATITNSVRLTGRLIPNAERVRAVSARFPGAIKQVLKSTGDAVKIGDRLAIVESNDSLQTYAVTAPIEGVIVERHANPGEVASAEPLFVIADYRRLWAELSLFPRDLAKVKVGQKVALTSVENGEPVGEGSLVRIAPAEGASHGSLSGVYTARVEIDNAAAALAPGLFVGAEVAVGQTEVPLAVKRSGLQAFRDFTVVFAQVDDTYEVRMLELGQQDATHVEVLGGIEAGTRYVAENSYLIKADIDKSGASHDH